MKYFPIRIKFHIQRQRMNFVLLRKHLQIRMPCIFDTLKNKLLVPSYVDTLIEFQVPMLHHCSVQIWKSVNLQGITDYQKKVICFWVTKEDLDLLHTCW